MEELRYKTRACKGCGTEIRVYNSTQNKCRDCSIKTAKPIAQKGKEGKKWDTFRDKVARPYLDKRDGIACHKCGVMPYRKPDGTHGRHDVEHQKKRGSHADAKYDVNHLIYLCRTCHIQETDQLHWTKRT